MQCYSSVGLCKSHVALSTMQGSYNFKGRNARVFKGFQGPKNTFSRTPIMFYQRLCITLKKCKCIQGLSRTRKYIFKDTTHVLPKTMYNFFQLLEYLFASMQIIISGLKQDVRVAFSLSPIVRIKETKKWPNTMAHHI